MEYEIVLFHEQVGPVKEDNASFGERTHCTVLAESKTENEKRFVLETFSIQAKCCTILVSWQ